MTIVNLLETITVVLAPDTRNSFITSPDSMRTDEIFDSIIAFCGFPEMVPFTYIRLLNSWLQGFIYDAVFVDFVAWHAEPLVKNTICLIDAFAGGSI